MIDEKTLQDFKQDGLTLIDEAMDQITPEGCDIGGVNAIFRCLHTLKGASGFLGLQAMSHFVHKFEDLLKEWQESGRGLGPVEAEKVHDGLKLVNEAMVNAADLTVPEKPEYKEFLKSLSDIHVDTGKASIKSLETILGDLKEKITPENEELFSKEIASIVNELEQILENANSLAKEFSLPVTHKDLLKAELAGNDITDKCKRILDALEKIAVIRSSAFDSLDMNKLDEDLAFMKQNLKNGVNLLTWDILQDLCDISPEVVEESFRRFWTEGLLLECDIELKERTEETQDAKSEEKDVPEDKEKVDKNKLEAKQEAQPEEYLRVSSTVLQKMTDSTSNLVADRNSLENLIQEMGTHVPARYLRYLQDNYKNLDEHVNGLERELGALTNRQLNDVFRRLPSMVNSLKDSLNKKIDLKLSGGEIEIPRNLIRALNDPLVHIVRNSIDHGIETPEIRKDAGKPEKGTLSVKALRNEDRLTIEIIDDGKGLDSNVIREKAIRKGLISSDQEMEDNEILQLIFQPGFSTKDQATDVSGRGVGMDVVKTAIEGKSGRINLDSKLGEGTTLELILPLADGNKTQDVLLVRAGKQTYGIEYKCLKEILDMEKISIHSFKEDSFFEYRNELVPFIYMQDLFEGMGFHEPEEIDLSDEKGRIIVVEDEQKNMIACRVDEVFNKIKVVVIPFVHDFLKDNPILRGSAVIGTREPYLIMDFRDVEKLI